MPATGLLDGTTWSISIGTGTPVAYHMLTVASTLEAREVDHTGSLYDPGFMTRAGGKSSLTMTLEGPFDKSAVPLNLRSVYTFTQLVDVGAAAFTFLGVILGIEHREGPDGPRQQLTVKNTSSFNLTF